MMETRSSKRKLSTKTPSVTSVVEIEMVVLSQRSEQEEQTDELGGGGAEEEKEEEVRNQSSEEKEHMDGEGGEGEGEKEEPYENVRARGIARNEAFVKSLNLEKIYASIAAPPQRKRPKASDVTQPTRIVNLRVKFGITTASDESTQQPTSLACPKCNEYATSMLLPNQAARELYMHQQGLLCKTQWEERLLPPTHKSFEVSHGASKEERFVLRILLLLYLNLS